MCCSDRCLIQRYKTYERCDDVTSLTWRRVISHVTLSSPPARCPARTVWRTASWRPSARWTWCRPTAAPWSPSTYSLSAFWNQMQILFCGTRKKRRFLRLKFELWELLRSEMSHICAVEVVNHWRCISVSIYWVIFCIRSIKRASCGRCAAQE